MKKTANIAVLLSVAILTYLLVDKLIFRSGKKIGVVQMDKLLYEYKGTKEATEKYSAKMKSWQRQSDSLREKLNALYNELRLDSVSNDKQKLARDTKVFLLFRQSYLEHMESNEKRAEEEDKQVTLGVVNQVNECIKAFAKQQGFDVIFINSQQQAVGYCEDELDVTEEILEFANKKYNGVNQS